jgi:hypothetical protein
MRRHAYIRFFLAFFIFFSVSFLDTSCISSHGKKYQKVKRGRPTPCPVKDC